VAVTSDGQGAYAFLKFNVSGVTGQVTNAWLNARTLNSMTDLWLYWLVHSNWTESNLTWSYFTGYGTYSMGFASSNASYGYLWSRQSSNPPVLEVTYEP